MKLDVLFDELGISLSQITNLYDDNIVTGYLITDASGKTKDVKQLPRSLKHVILAKYI